MPTRRSVIATSAAAVWTMAGHDLQAAASARPTFVLVHGAWHGGWCWRDVRKRLEAKGARVFTPTLTGLGERAHLLSADISLDTHVHDVTGVIEAEELDRVVLCGHSYGGMVITGVCDRVKNRIESVIYLDAALPMHGQSMSTQNPASTPQTRVIEERFLRAASSDPLTFPPIDDVSFLGVPPEHASASWLRRRMTPHPARTWFDPIMLKNSGSNGLKRTYVLCTKPLLAGASFTHHAARVRTDPSWTYRELATGHDAMVTAPKDVARLLLEAA